MHYPFLQNINSLTSVIHKSESSDKKTLDILNSLYSISGKAIASFQHKDADTMDQILSIEYNLGRVLESSLVDDPTLFKLKETAYLVNGVKVVLKPDTGAKDSTIDAREIDWVGADLKELEAIHLEFAEAHPKSGMLTHAKIEKYLPQYKGINFGTINRFLMPVHEGKNDKNYQDKEIIGPIPVISLANPKNTSGKRAVLRPGIERSIKQENSEKTFTAIFNLVNRKNMMTRGLLGKDLLKDNYEMIVLDKKKDIKIIDLSKVDLLVIEKAIQPILSL